MITVPASTRGKDVKVEYTKTRLFVGLSGSDEPIIDVSVVFLEKTKDAMVDELIRMNPGQFTTSVSPSVPIRKNGTPLAEWNIPMFNLDM